MLNNTLLTGLNVGVLISTIVACAPSSSSPNGEPSANGSVMESQEVRSAYREVSLSPETMLVGADPQQIALKAYGNSEPVEGNFKETVVLVDQTDHQAIVTVTQTGLLDDSVEGMRYWIEFAPEGGQWRLTWVGRQVRCYPNRGSQAWTTELCN